MIRYIILFVLVIGTLVQALIEFGYNPTFTYIEISIAALLTNILYEKRLKKGGKKIIFKGSFQEGR